MYTNSVALPRLDLAGAVPTQGRLGTSIARKLFPVFQTDKKKATMPSLLQNTARIYVVKRAPKSFYAQASAELSDKEYSCAERGIEVPIDASDYDVLGQDGAEKIATEVGHDILLSAIDHDVISILTGTTGEATLAGQITEPDSGENWNEAGGKPIDDIAKAEGTLSLRFGAGRTVLFISQYELEALQVNDQIRSEYRRIVGQSNADATNRRIRLDAMATLFGVDEVVVSDRRYITSNKGQTNTWAYLWPARYALLVRVPADTQDLLQPAFGRTFEWTGANQGAEGELIAIDPDTGIAVETYRDEPKKSDVLRESTFTDERILNVEAAQMIKLPATD